MFFAFITFIVILGIVMGLVYASGPKTIDVRQRLSRVLKPPTSEYEEDLPGVGGSKTQNVFVAIGKMLPLAKGKKLSKDQVILTRAGYRGENALLAMRGAKVFFCIVSFVLVIWSGLSTFNPFVIIMVAVVLGWYIPELWVLNRVKARQKRLRLGLPDAMDLMVICVEVGLGMDQALMKVAEEISIVHPDLSSELHMVNLEMRVGKTRIDALRELARRTGLDEIKALVGILVQTDRFGTSIVDSLRTFSDELRTKRRQRAEELSAKVSVKMVPVLVFFIFPALMVVILGPAILIIQKTLLTTFK